VRSSGRPYDRSMGGGIDPVHAEGAALGPSDSAETHDPRRPEPQDAGEWLGATCPYLRSTDGTWRSVVPQRGQRCWGQTPPAPLEPATQERLCRTSAHVGCEIFVAAERRHLDSLTRDHVAPERLDGRFGVLVRPSTLVLDEPSHRVQVPAPVAPLRNTRVSLGVAVAAIVIVVALFAGLGSGATPAASPTVPPIAAISPTLPAASAPPALSQAPQPSESVAPGTLAPATPAATASPPPSVQPTAGPSPRIRTTYRVKKGDTLAAIATQFGVSKKQIRAVNDFGNPPHLRYGTLINIPYP